jgi:hypothetical protein
VAQHARNLAVTVRAQPKLHANAGRQTSGRSRSAGVLGDGITQIHWWTLLLSRRLIDPYPAGHAVRVQHVRDDLSLGAGRALADAKRGADLCHGHVRLGRLVRQEVELA